MAAPTATLRSDYAPPPYLTHSVTLGFVLNEDVTRVTARLGLRPNPALPHDGVPLVLDGQHDVKLLGVKLDGKELKEVDDYTLTGVGGYESQEWGQGDFESHVGWHCSLIVLGVVGC